MHLILAWGVILSGLLFTGLRLAVPLLLAALGETLAEKVRRYQCRNRRA